MPDFSVTQQLNEYTQLGPQEREELFLVLYPELQRIARALMRNENPANTLNPTALLHEAFLALFQGTKVDYANRKHFFALAARKMRHILIDAARSRDARARGRKLWGMMGARVEADRDLVLHLDGALEYLRRVDERLCTVADLHFVLGLSLPEVAAALSYSESSARRDWLAAQGMLEEYLLRHA